MVAAKTSDALLAAIKRDAQMPPADGRLTDAEILDIASEALSAEVADLLVSVRQQRWVQTHADVAITSGVATYRIPSRALAAGVSDVLIVDGETEYDAPELSPEERYRYSDGQRGPWRSPYGYAWQGDHIVLVPEPSETRYSLRLRYPRQPGRLVAVEECGLVTSTTATTIELDATPSAWGASETLDVVEGTPHADTLMLDASATISGTTVTIAAGVGSEVAAGDYVCLAGETCIPPVPESVWPYLVAACVARVVYVIGDVAAIQAAQIMAAQAERRVRSVLAPRNRGARELVTHHNSALRGGRMPWGRP